MNISDKTPHAGVFPVASTVFAEHGDLGPGRDTLPGVTDITGEFSVFCGAIGIVLWRHAVRIDPLCQGVLTQFTRRKRQNGLNGFHLRRAQSVAVNGEKQSNR